jgi:hypothetical protein
MFWKYLGLYFLVCGISCLVFSGYVALICFGGILQILSSYLVDFTFRFFEKREIIGCSVEQLYQVF